MSQADLVIANQSGSAFRADLNNQLMALGTLMSGTSAPSTTYAYMLWADTNNNRLKIRNSANNAWVELFQLDGTLTMEDGDATNPGLCFRDDTNTGLFSGGADELNISTGGTERFVVNSDGYVGITKASPGTNLEVNKSQTTTTFTATNQAALRLNNSNNAANNYFTALSFATATTANSSDSAIVSYSTASGSSDLVFFVDNSNTLTERARIQAGGGISFNGDTAAANALNDYETGSFTPSASQGTFSTTNATYTRIGRMVMYQIYGTFSSITNSSEQQLSGFPFAPISSQFYSCAINHNSSLTIVGQIHGSNAYLRFMKNDNTKATATEMSGKMVICSGVYQTAA